MRTPTKKVTLYIDLPPYWHERPTDELWMYAGFKPNDHPPIRSLRVAIEVDLPHVETAYGADHEAQAAWSCEPRDRNEIVRIVEVRK